MEALDQFFSSMLTLERWPFWSAVLVFMIIGHFTSRRLFTRERAYIDWGMPAVGVRPFWYWGRETLVLHPLLGGAVLGALWQDPEGAGWRLVPSMMYFAAAGAVSLLVWVPIKAAAKKRGLKLSLPGDSDRPSQGPES